MSDPIEGRLCCCVHPQPVGSWPYTCFNRGCLGIVPIEPSNIGLQIPSRKKDGRKKERKI